MKTYTVYNRPKDYPDKVIVRAWDCSVNPPIASKRVYLAHSSLDVIMKKMRNKGFYFLQRNKSDDVCIEGSFI